MFILGSVNVLILLLLCCVQTHSSCLFLSLWVFLHVCSLKHSKGHSISTFVSTNLYLLTCQIELVEGCFTNISWHTVSCVYQCFYLYVSLRVVSCCRVSAAVFSPLPVAQWTHARLAQRHCLSRGRPQLYLPDSAGVLAEGTFLQIWQLDVAREKELQRQSSVCSWCTLTIAVYKYIYADCCKVSARKLTGDVAVTTLSLVSVTFPQMFDLSPPERMSRVLSPWSRFDVSLK